MQTKPFVFFKKYHIIFIFFYIIAFSQLLTGINQFCHAHESPFTSCQTNTTVAQNPETPRQLQENIAKNILRLHIIANSDTDADQALKLAVRDEIITSLQTALQNADSPSKAAEIIMSRTTQLEESAYRVLSRYDSDYSINISLGEHYFPIKQYGDLIFPAGNYQALCVEIGKAEGRNWWCVLFPSLCFVDETTATVPEPSKEALKNTLTEEEYASLLVPSETDNAQNSPNPSPAQTVDIPATPIPNTQPELRFGILDWFQSHITKE